jgi:hypothetical protein
MASHCPRSQMNASEHFASTWSKRNRHQLFHSALAHIHPTTKRLTTLQLAGSEDVKTVSGKEYKNITERGFSAAPVKKTHRPAAVTCGVSSRDGSPNSFTCARRGNGRIQAGDFFSNSTHTDDSWLSVTTLPARLVTGSLSCFAATRSRRSVALEMTVTEY